MFEEGIPIVRGDERGKELADKAAPLDAEKPAHSEVGLYDAPGLIEGKVGEGSEFIEVHVTGPRFFDDVLRLAKLLILHLERYLVHEKLMEHLIVGQGVEGACRDERFGPCTEVPLFFFA